MTEIWFIRHGETDWNIARRLQGWRDIPLNDFGREQAAFLAERLADDAREVTFDAAYTSDLQRTQDTMAPTSSALGLTALLAPGMRERHYGVLEGLAVGEMADKAPANAYSAWMNREVDGSVGDGETLRQFHNRVVEAVEAIASRHPGQRVLVMTHGGVLDIIWRHAHRVDLAEKRKRVPMLNVSINRVVVHPDHWQVLSWGDVSHVPAPVGADVIA